MKIQDILTRFASFPVGRIDEIAPGTSLVIAPHPDDESLGCGGFIAMAVKASHPPVVVIVSDGSRSHPGSRNWPPERLSGLRQTETGNAVKALGLSTDRLVFMGLPDTAVPTEGDAFELAIGQLLSLVSRHECTSVLVPWRYDPHCDHEAVWLMGERMKSLRPELKVFSYPVWGLTLPPSQDIAEPPLTGWRLDVRDVLAQKIHAIEQHRSQRGLVVTDAPEGFVLPENLLGRLLQPYEVLIAS